MNKSVTIVIPNYNGSEILPKNLPTTIKVAEKYGAQIIVVDDKSTDNSVDIVKKNYPTVKLIEKDKNEGFSSTVNLGVKNAKTDLICLLNSDVIPSDNFLDPLFPYFNDSQTAAVGMQDFSDDQQTHGRGKFILHRGFLLHQRFDDGQTSLQSGTTGWVSCGSGLFSKKIWDELGGLDELLNPFYFEDVDYGYRAWKSGYKMYFEGTSHVDHVHKIGAIKSNYNNQRIKTISYRNQFYFTQKNLTDINLIIKHILWLIPNMLIAAKNKDTPFFMAFIQALNHVSNMLESRKKYIRNFKYSDAQVIQDVIK